VLEARQHVLASKRTPNQPSQSPSQRSRYDEADRNLRSFTRPNPTHGQALPRSFVCLLSLDVMAWTEALQSRVKRCADSVEAMSAEVRCACPPNVRIFLGETVKRQVAGLDWNDRAITRQPTIESALASQHQAIQVDGCEYRPRPLRSALQCHRWPPGLANRRLWRDCYCLGVGDQQVELVRVHDSRRAGVASARHRIGVRQRGRLRR
jgi:hypothetical protein